MAGRFSSSGSHRKIFLLEYLLLIPTPTQQIKRFLRAGLSVFAAGELIVAILPEGLLGIVQKVSCYQENKPLLWGFTNGEFVPFFGNRLMQEWRKRALSSIGMRESL